MNNDQVPLNYPLFRGLTVTFQVASLALSRVLLLTTATPVGFAPRLVTPVLAILSTRFAGDSLSHDILRWELP